jgi:hypothetical protein
MFWGRGGVKLGFKMAVCLLFVASGIVYIIILPTLGLLLGVIDPSAILFVL